MPVAFCEVQTDEKTVTYVTLSEPANAFKRGLVSEQIIGQLLNPLKAGEALEPDNFGRNPAFVSFLHASIKSRGPSVPGLIDAAQKQGDGLVVITDGRTRTPQDAIPPEDILGGFEVVAGFIVPDAYHPNPNHRLLTSDGFFRLEATLLEGLLEDIANINTHEPS
ncbi:hypothetical protein J2X15_003250 [Rhodoferax saidenbachensis]|uniref:Uncharacterized protein n=1 Tax=Rhodoferax saidenbachensis TaxID=1484693 RepID=A0ABU1ZSZ1_9BURK|nr:hypothetical protein [Rhodoferax saidenbachensis]